MPSELRLYFPGMIVFTAMKILFLGAVAQIALMIILSILPSPIMFAIYIPWFYLGELLLPSTGPGSHAMGGVGGLLVAIVGFIVYAVLIGRAIDRYLKARLRGSDPSSWE